MATITATALPNPNNRDLIGCVRIQYTGIRAGDTCSAIGLARYADRSVQVSGTFGGATVAIQGTNEDSTNFYTLSDSGGLDLSLTAPGRPRFITEATLHTKPLITGGDGTTDLTITFFCRGQVA